jgi:hypothetical protein
MSKTIVMGGVRYKSDSSVVKLNYDRMAEWKNLEDTGGPFAKYKDLDNRALVETVIKDWGIDALYIKSTKILHNEIVKLYNRKYHLHHTPQDVKIGDKPPNYTEELKTFLKISGRQDIKGYCPFEPLVRIAQLGKIDLSKLYFVDPVEFDDYPLFSIFTENMDLRHKLKKIKSLLSDWEEYYNNIAKKIISLSDQISQL